MPPSQPSAAAKLTARAAVHGPLSAVDSERASANFGQLSALEQREAAAALEIFRHPFRPGELAGPVHTAGSWLWHGYLGCGKLTLLTSQVAKRAKKETASPFLFFLSPRDKSFKKNEKKTSDGS